MKRYLHFILLLFAVLVLGCDSDTINEDCLCNYSEEGYIDFNISNDSVFNSFSGKLTHYESYNNSSLIDFGDGYYLLNIKRQDVATGSYISFVIYIEPENKIYNGSVNFEIYHKQGNSYYKLKKLLGTSSIQNLSFNSKTLKCKGEFEYTSISDMKGTIIVSGSFDVQLIENKRI